MKHSHNFTQPYVPHWLQEDMPPFDMTEEQKARLASYNNRASGDAARRSDLMTWHQQHCWEHRQIVGVFGSLDPYHFTRRWEAEFGDMSWADSEIAAAREDAHV